MSIEKLPGLVNGDQALVHRGRYFSERFMVEVGARQYLIEAAQGRIASVTPIRTPLQSWTFAIRAEAETWERFWQPIPEPGHHDIIALFRYRRMRLEGNLQPLLANLLYLKMVLAAPRAREARP